MAGVSGVAGAAVEAGVWLLCAVTTSTLAAVSCTVTVSLCCWVREVELVGVAVTVDADVDWLSTPQAASKATKAMKKAAHKKRFNAKTPPQNQYLQGVGPLLQYGACAAAGIYTAYIVSYGRSCVKRS